jgi:hypothetical protein
LRHILEVDSFLRHRHHRRRRRRNRVGRRRRRKCSSACSGSWFVPAAPPALLKVLNLVGARGPRRVDLHVDSALGGVVASRRGAMRRRTHLRVHSVPPPLSSSSSFLRSHSRSARGASSLVLKQTRHAQSSACDGPGIQSCLYFQTHNIMAPIGL